ncbi:MAG: hypothetical protein AB7G12_10940 [Thermoanaerobaculia bacterium]
MNRRGTPILALFALLGAARPAAATVYHVGPSPGNDFAELTGVAPLVGPGDLVLVEGNHVYAPVLFQNDGAPGSPIVVRGLRVAGARPVIEGGTNTIEIQSDHFVLESFEIRRGTFRCVYHHSDDLTLRDLFVHDCEAHGILSADEDSGSLTVEYTEVSRAGNGTTQHGLYVTSDQNAHPGSVFRLEHSFIHDLNGGNALKSRAERNEIRYNWFEGTRYHLMELIGPDEGAVTPPPAIREDSDVVGNILIHKAYDPPLMPWGTDPPAIDGSFYFVRIGSDISCDGGGENSTRGRYRFVNNIFARQSDGVGSDVFRPFGYLQSVEMSNNVVWSVPAGAVPIFRFGGIGSEACWTDGEQIAGQKNWIETGATHVPSGWTGTLTGTVPNFANAGAFDYRPTSTSPFLDQGTSTPTAPPGFPFPAPTWPPASEPPPRTVFAGPPAPPRATAGIIDIGAWEFPPAIFVDGFESQNTAYWDAAAP